MIGQKPAQMRVLQLVVLLAVIILVLRGVVLIGKTAVDNEFVAYENNPVMELGNPGDWDGGTAVTLDMVQVDDTYYLFYVGGLSQWDDPPTIGFATSTNGITWTKSISNPILAGDGTGFDAAFVADPAIIYEDGTWTLFYGGAPSLPVALDNYMIGRATASDPAGPWTRDANAVLTMGRFDEWDSAFVLPSTILRTSDGYIMYYAGGTDFYSADDFMMGMATSPDGITWTKYDDPTTTMAPYAESDPILQTGGAGGKRAWDSGMAWLGQVRLTPCGWEMYYTGATSLSEAAIGYATSQDGIHWTKDDTNPIYEAMDDPVAQTLGGIVEAAFVIDVGNERWMYYDYGRGDDPPAFGLAKAPLSCQSVYLPTILK